MAHTLKGLAGTLEVDAVREVAAQLELVLTEDRLDKDQLDDVAKLSDALDSAIAPALEAAASLAKKVEKIVEPPLSSIIATSQLLDRSELDAALLLLRVRTLQNYLTWFQAM